MGTAIQGLVSLWSADQPFLVAPSLVVHADSTVYTRHKATLYPKP